MKFILAFVLSIFGFNAFAHNGMPGMGGSSPSVGDLSPLVCADAAHLVCAQLQFLSVVNPSTEGRFIVKVTTPGNLLVQDFKLDLWMDMGNGHGHTSAPVDIQALPAVNQFQIGNAWFVMQGTWLVRMDFDVQGQPQHIEIPVTAAAP
jgi:hypothetical protein